jgi:YD repeat-containing protein
MYNISICACISSCAGAGSEGVIVVAKVDLDNRLISASNALGVIIYRYNGLGDRLQETTNGQTTTFTVDLAACLTQTL